MAAVLACTVDMLRFNSNWNRSRFSIYQNAMAVLRGAGNCEMDLWAVLRPNSEIA